MRSLSAVQDYLFLGAPRAGESNEERIQRIAAELSSFGFVEAEGEGPLEIAEAIVEEYGAATLAAA